LATAEPYRYPVERGSPAVSDNRTYDVTLTETELTTIISALAYQQNRQGALAREDLKQGREREALARRESAEQTLALSERLAVIGAQGTEDGK
jgi:hypothetical protein